MFLPCFFLFLPTQSILNILKDNNSLPHEVHIQHIKEVAVLMPPLTVSLTPFSQSRMWRIAGWVEGQVLPPSCSPLTAIGWPAMINISIFKWLTPLRTCLFNCSCFYFFTLQAFQRVLQPTFRFFIKKYFSELGKIFDLVAPQPLHFSLHVLQTVITK